MDDILKEISDNDLEKLSYFYKEYEHDLPQVLSVIKTGIEWRQIDKEIFRFYSPNNSWKTDGTFVCFIKPHCNDIFISTLDPLNKNLMDALRYSKLIEYDKLVVFCLHEKIKPTLLQILDEKGLKYEYDTCFSMTISKEKALQFDTRCPDEVYCKQLDTSSVEKIYSVYKYKNKPPGYLAKLIEMNKCYGLFLKSTDELVCCAFKTAIGQIGMLQTMDEFKRKGYGSLVTRIIAKSLAEEGIQPFATITENNEASKEMFNKIGFQFLWFSNYILVSTGEEEKKNEK